MNTGHGDRAGRKGSQGVGKCNEDLAKVCWAYVYTSVCVLRQHLEMEEGWGDVYRAPEAE